MKSRVRRFGSAVAVVAVLLAACGGSSETPDDTGQAEQPEPEANVTDDGEGDEDEEAAAPEDFEIVDGVLQPLADGFPSGPITFLVEDDPGSGDSIYATQLQDALSDISPVDIRVEHRGDFGNLGTWEAIAFMDTQEAAQEGRVVLVGTLPGFITDSVVIHMPTELGIGVDDLNGLAFTEAIPYALHQNVDAPWGTTLEEMIDYCLENPGEIRYISGGPGSGQDVTFRAWMRDLGCEVDTIIGGGQGDRARAVAAGEGDVTVSPPNLVIPFFEDGRVVVTLIAGDEPAPEPWPEALNVAQAGIENDPGLQYRGWLMATDVPAAHRQWMEQLVRLGVEQDSFRSGRESQVPGLNHTFVDHDGMTTLFRSYYDIMVPVLDEQGVYHGLD